MRTLYKHGGSHKGVPEMTPEQIKARDAYVEKLRKKREEQDKIKTQVDEELFGYAGGGKYYPHGGKHEEEEGIGTKVMNFMQKKYNEFTGKGPGQIPVEKFESTNENYSGMNEVIDWMQEQERSGMGVVGNEKDASAIDVLERGRQTEDTRDQDAANYMPSPSGDDVERKAMMFSNVFNDVSSNPYMGMDMRGPVRQDFTEEKRARIVEAFKKNNVPEEWQNEFFETLRSMRPGITQGGYSGKSGMQVERLEAGTIDTPRTEQKLQMRETSPVAMPQATRRGLFRRR